MSVRFLVPIIFFILMNIACQPKATITPLQQLGRHLFFDNQLSANASKSCGSCHDPKLFFTDGYKKSIGWYGDVQLRNSPSLINSVDRKSLNWANPDITTFEKQMNTPLFSQVHLEMGMDEQDNAQAVKILDQYKWYFKNNKDKKSWALIKKSIASYCELLVSRNSTYDKFLETNDSTLLTQQQWQGHELFFSERLKCAQCHGGKDFDTPMDSFNTFANIGLYNINGQYPNGDNGLALISKKKSDAGKFKVPSLRNVTTTAPYFHDGSALNLNEVIEHYINGGRKITTGEFAGDGAQHPNKNNLISGFHIEAEEKRNLIAFLEALTDSSVLVNPLFKNPFAIDKK